MNVGTQYSRLTFLNCTYIGAVDRNFLYGINCRLMNGLQNYVKTAFVNNQIYQTGV